MYRHKSTAENNYNSHMQRSMICIAGSYRLLRPAVALHIISLGCYKQKTLQQSKDTYILKHVLPVA